ncbi:hypothetical protein DWUX_2199 [Desulfovibrio diazotrophicus]|nr:hypothetical protein DWUX_2199 [Desulfovibrio diazotrophicus]
MARHSGVRSRACSMEPRAGGRSVCAAVRRGPARLQPPTFLHFSLPGKCPVPQARGSAGRAGLKPL